MEHLDRLIARGLQNLGLLGDPAPWSELARLLEAWNRQLNLSGHQSAPEIAERLLLESAAFCRVLPEADSIADLGSGAGIPGLPIALCRPDVRVLLIESRQRRHHFQRAAIRALGLSNVEPLLGRAEELEITPCAGVVAQAFRAPDRAIELMIPWIGPGGWLALATTPTASLPAHHVALARSETRPYEGPDRKVRRAAWVAWLE